MAAIWTLAALVRRSPRGVAWIEAAAPKMSASAAYRQPARPSGRRLLRGDWRPRCLSRAQVPARPRARLP